MNNPEFHKGYAKYAKIADEDRKSWYIPYALSSTAVGNLVAFQ